MRKVFATLFLLFGLFVPALSASTYYLSPSGNDSNNGLSSNYAWATPNHSLNCGDVILAAAGNYNNANFYTGKWGQVNCPAGNSVAWLKCATFDTCKIYASNNQGMWVDASYWGVQGWEVSANANDAYGTCFLAAPRWSNKITTHHIIFANDVANGCSQAGFAIENFGGTAGVDYFAILGDIVYNAAQGSGSCASGISIWQPALSDYNGGTHIYVAGNLTYANLDPRQCAGTSPTDGEGIIFDTFDGTQGGMDYFGQAVAYSNLVIGNGGRGIEVYNNKAGSNHASIWINQNTIWGNNTDPNQSWYGCGELQLTQAGNVHTFGNLISTRQATGCGGHPIYAVSTSAGDSTDSDDGNFAYGYGGNNTFLYASGSLVYASDNTLGKSPAFKSTTVPGAPQCSGKANAVACMAQAVANFTPTATGSTLEGYVAPRSGSVSDPLFPKWLCTANVPAGLITMGCS